jgi:hypothetical protein
MFQQFDFTQYNPESSTIIIAFIALILSFCSTILALWSVWLQRKHNHVSVRPIAASILANYIDNLAVKIKNNGLGPLIIKKFFVQKGNNILGDNLIDLMPQNPENVPWRDFAKGINSHILSPGEELCILELKTEEISEEFIEFRNEVRMTLAPLSIKIEYENIYEERQPEYKENLYWFGS